MFVGHYSAALAAKALEPRAPLWTYVIAAQFMDVGWATLVMGGVEKVRVDESLPGSALDLYHMPYTHSLPGAAAWAVGAALLAGVALKLPRRAAVFVGLTASSHWLLDLLVHRPDLALWPGGPKVGLGLWNLPVPEQAVEIGLLAVAGAFLAGVWGRGGRSAWPLAAFLALLVGLQIVGLFTPQGGGAVRMGVITLAAYFGVAALAWLVERRPVDAAARLPAEPSRA